MGWDKIRPVWTCAVYELYHSRQVKFQKWPALKNRDPITTAHTYTVCKQLSTAVILSAIHLKNEIELLRPFCWGKPEFMWAWGGQKWHFRPSCKVARVKISHFCHPKSQVNSIVQRQNRLYEMKWINSYPILYIYLSTYKNTCI